MAVEITAVMRFETQEELTEEEFRVQVEDLWLGTLLAFEEEEV
jgi:hypothetical protein